MKQSNIMALSAVLLTSITTAKPLAHQHLHKRDIVTVTVTEDFIETIDVIVEVYDGTPIATIISTEPAHAIVAQTTRDASQFENLAVAGKKQAATTSPTTSPTTAPTTAPQPSQQYGGQQWAQEWQQKQQDDQNEKIQEQADKIKQQEAQIEKQKQGDQQQAQANHQPSPLPQQQHQPQPPQISPQTQTQSTTPPQQQSGDESGGSGPSGGTCGAVGGKCTASDVTIYNDQGTGACGWANDTNSEDFFALASGTFGPYTNDAPGPHKNAFCGRMATISVNGKQVSGMLTDSCPGCTGWSLDLSQSLWNKVFDNEAGTRIYDVEWWFTSSAQFHGPAG